jgi:glycosyltransferase involved in cell wall biosynthesis
MLPDSKKISIIIPAYNEEKLIYNTLKVVEDTLCNPDPCEIIVVDDSSKDKTFSEAYRASEDWCNIKVVKNMGGKGKGAALKYGFKQATGEYVTFLDADLDIHPKQLRLFMEYMKKYNADVVIGSKQHPLSKVNYPLRRKVLSWFYNRMVDLLFGLNLNDTQVGLKLFKYEVLKDILDKVLVKKFAFDLELLANAHDHGYKIVEAPIEIRFQRSFNRIDLKDVWKMFVDTCAIFYRLKIIKYYRKAI